LEHFRGWCSAIVATDYFKLSHILYCGWVVGGHGCLCEAQTFQCLAIVSLLKKDNSVRLLNNVAFAALLQG